MLAVPSYIKASGVMVSAIEYEWRPYQGAELIEKVSRNLSEAVSVTSLRANFALALGVAEWMMWRLDSSSYYPQLVAYVNALWARTIDKAYLKVNSLDTPPDTGDQRIGPLRALENALYTAFRKATQNHPERGEATAGLASLVRYTLPDPTAFDDWLGRSLMQFNKYFALDPQNRSGRLVPRAFLDPEIEITFEAIPFLLDEQLSSIDYAGNPFLATPDEMLATGFKGTPYRYLP